MKDTQEGSGPTAEILAQHVEWLQRLARHLVRDEDLALDLAQDTLTALLERPPARPTSLRAWLRKVLANLFHERLRGDSSRRARERGASRPELTPSTDELLERVQVQGRMADLLLELEEPTRATVLLRFYEDLPPREIARRQGVPVATVKSRLARALERLRSRLDDGHDGQRRTWVRILAPLALAAPPIAPSGTSPETPAPATPTTIGALLNLKLVLTTTALVLSGALYWRVRPSGEGSAARLVERTEDAFGPGPGASLGASSPVTPRDGRRPLRGENQQAPAASIATAPRHRVRGRIVDVEGLGVHGVRVHLAGSDESALSVAGDFEFETTLSGGRLAVEDERWIAVRTGSWRQDGRIEPVLVVAPALAVAGRVVDEWGRGLAGTRVALELPAGFGARFEERLDASIQENWNANTDVDGFFRLEPLPAIVDAELRAVRTGKEPAVLAAPLASRGDLWIELRDPRPESEDVLAGRVVRADGRPAAEALVTLARLTVPVDERGEFALDLSRSGLADRVATDLVAAEPGSLPARLARDESLGERGWPPFVQLTLGGPTLTIEGRVLEEDGTARVGARVWVTDGSSLGLVGSMPLGLEALLAGGAVPDEALDSIAELDPSASGRDYSSARPLGRPDALFSWVETDPDGHFQLGGLEDRDYVLSILDRELSWVTKTDPIPAGTRGVEVVVRYETTWPHLAGRVVTAQGEPVPDVSITPWIPVFESHRDVPGGTADLTRWFARASERTDAQGRFELDRVPRQYLSFYLVSDDIVPGYASVEDVVDPDDFTITVRARVHLEVVAETGPGTPDAFRLSDGAGNPVTILEMRADGHSNHLTFPLTGGRSGIVTATTDAAWLHLLRAGEELDALPVRLVPGQVNTLVH